MRAGIFGPGLWGRCALAVFLMAEPGLASAADLYFCEERDNVGFQLEGGAPERVRFVPARFSLYVEMPVLALTVDGGKATRFLCQYPYPDNATLMTCSDGTRLFMFDTSTGQFSLGRVGGLFFVEPPGPGLTREPLTVSWGTCER